MTMRVLVAVAMQHVQEVIEVELPEGSRVRDAIDAAGVMARYPQIEWEQAAVGIWAKASSRDAVLREGDRVEVYRALKADAKAMRRARARVKPASPRSRSGP